jgi:hypothetical protein
MKQRLAIAALMFCTVTASGQIRGIYNDPQSDVADSLLNPYGDGHWLTVMSNIPADKVWVDPFGYGHVNAATLAKLEANLLQEIHYDGRMISIPPTNWVGDPPRCLAENGCINVALYMVHFDPQIAQKGINLMDDKQASRANSSNR